MVIRAAGTEAVVTAGQTFSDGAQLAGRVAVVTGGGRGIGRAIALALATAGASTAVLARTKAEVGKTVEIIEQTGGRAQPFVADVTDAIGVGATMARIERELGPISLLVNNAARPGPIGPFCETDVEDWWRALRVNLQGPMLCSRAVLPGMISRRHGRIVNIASNSAPIAYFSSYVTSKTALIRFTETVAEEVRAHGVRMFSVAPGTVRTAMSEHSLRSPEGQKWLPWFRRIFDEGLDVPEERSARLILELASGRADRLSGRFLSVWDDLDVLLQGHKEIEENNLLSLRIRTLDARGGNPALVSIRAEAERAPRYVVRIERSFEAPSARIFEMWTQPDAVKKWFVHGARVHWSEYPAIDARPGGQYRWSVVTNDNDAEIFAFRGTYREVERARKLVFSWEWHTLPIDGVEGPGNTLVVIEFVQQGTATKVVLTQTALPSEAARDAHDKGWRRCFDGIASALSVGI